MCGDMGVGRALSSGVSVFCYGALLSGATRQRRGLSPLGGAAPVRGVLPDHRLDFNHRAGYGNVVPCPRRGGGAEEEAWYEVHGVVLTLSREDADRLKTAEIGYRVQDVDVVVYPEDEGAAGAWGGGDGMDAGVVKAFTFVSDPWSTVVQSRTDVGAFDPLLVVARDGQAPRGLPAAYLLPSLDDLSLRPTARYLGLLRAGAKESGLDAAYVSWLCDTVVPLGSGSGEHADDARFDTQGRAFARMLLFLTVCILLLSRNL